jgi:aspartate/methionine/tyrosine aminotransferase
MRRSGEAIDVGAGCLVGVPAVDALWDAVRQEWSPNVGDDPRAVTRFADAVCELVAAEDGAPIDPASVVATHGARNALCHALVSLEPHAPVYYPATDGGAAIAILRSGHRPSALAWDISASVGDLLAAIPRHGRAGLVLHFPSKPSGGVPTSGDWDAIIGLAERNLVVIDDVYGFLDAMPRPIGAFIDAGGVVVNSLRIRLAAPGLRVGWLLATGDRVAIARESMACESGGVSSPLLDLAGRAMARAVVDDTGSAVRDELARRRTQLRQSLAAELLTRLTAGDHGFYAALADTARPNDLFVAETAGYLRMCLGAHADYGEVAARLNALLISL